MAFAEQLPSIESNVMEEIIADNLPIALAVAFSPIPIIAVILMLFSQRPKSNGLGFLIGWVVGIAIVGGLVVGLAQTEPLSIDKAPTEAVSMFKILLGLILLGLAIIQWRNRPGPDEQPPAPRWVNSIDTLNPAAATGLGAISSGVNLKNLTLILAAAAHIAKANLSVAGAVFALSVFIIFASLTVAIPVIYYLLAGEKAEERLTTWKDWLLTNNATVMFILLLIFGVVLISEGLGELAA
jgi:hypothetical protein